MLREDKGRGICGRNLQPEVIRRPDEIVGIFDGDTMGEIVLLVQEAGDAEHPVAVRTGGVAAEGDGEQLERLLLPLEVEALDAPKDLVLVWRCGENGSRRRYEV